MHEYGIGESMGKGLARGLSMLGMAWVSEWVMGMRLMIGGHGHGVGVRE